MRPTDFEQFQTTVNLWFGLKIADISDVAKKAGCSVATISVIRAGRNGTTYKMAGEILQAIGIIESKYIAKWQQERARQRLAVEMAETYRTGVHNESH